MSRTLFLGDSHSCGYYISNYGTNKEAPNFWKENNYSEIYSQLNNKPVAVYAIPNGCNKKYTAWLRSMFDYYSDIDEVFVQTTYWNRHLLAVNKNLDTADGIKSNHFMHGPNPPPAPQDTPLIERWADLQVTDNYLEIPVRGIPNDCPNYKGFNFDELYTGMKGIFSESYAYTKLWHENITHLQYRDYCGDLFIIDNLCKNYNVNWYLWRINDRVVLPKNLNFYGNLDNCTVCNISAQEFIKQSYNYNIDEQTLDGEHYTIETHKIIAENFIPYIKHLTKPK